MVLLGTMSKLATLLFISIFAALLMGILAWEALVQDPYERSEAAAPPHIPRVLSISEAAVLGQQKMPMK